MITKSGNSSPPQGTSGLRLFLVSGTLDYFESCYQKLITLPNGHALGIIIAP